MQQKESGVFVGTRLKENRNQSTDIIAVVNKEQNTIITVG